MKLFNDEYDKDESNVFATWKCMCENNEDVITVCMPIKTLVDMNYRCIDEVLYR